MIIDIHAHPQFLEPQPGKIPSQPETRKLDIVANPQHFPVALGRTSQHYYQRDPAMLPLPEFINQMDEAKIDRIVLVNPAVKGVPVKPMNESVAELLETYPDRFIGFAGFDPNNGPQAVQEIEYAIENLGFSGIKTVSSVLELDINAQVSIDNLRMMIGNEWYALARRPLASLTKNGLGIGRKPSRHLVADLFKDALAYDSSSRIGRLLFDVAQ